MKYNINSKLSFTNNAQKPFKPWLDRDCYVAKKRGKKSFSEI